MDQYTNGGLKNFMSEINSMKTNEEVIEDMINTAKKQEEVNNDANVKPYKDGSVKVILDNPYDDVYGIDYDREKFRDGTEFRVDSINDLKGLVGYIEGNMKFHTKALAATGNLISVVVWPSNAQNTWIAEVRIIESDELFDVETRWLNQGDYYQNV
jgi:hypothetical protein